MTEPPHVQLIQMGTAFWVSRIVFAAASLGLADRLADEIRQRSRWSGNLPGFARLYPRERSPLKAERRRSLVIEIDRSHSVCR